MVAKSDSNSGSFLKMIGAAKMKNYNEFKRINIGSSDIASLIVRCPGSVSELCFGEDGCYFAYDIINEECKVPSYFKVKFEGETWIKIYDDDSLVYNETHAGMNFKIYGTCDDTNRDDIFTCIIKWEDKK